MGEANGPSGRAVRAFEAAMGALVLAMAVAIGLQVLASVLGLNPVLVLGRALPLVGDAITQNSLQDAQWHLLVAVGLLPAWLVWLRDRHVRVDFLYSGLPPRGRRVVDIGGNLLLGLPFLALAMPAAWDFLGRAWRSDQGSANAGLDDLWLVKALLPLGLLMLGLAVLWETARLVRPRGPRPRRDGP